MKGFNLSEWAINHRPFVWFLMILFVAAGVLSSATNRTAPKWTTSKPRLLD